MASEKRKLGAKQFVWVMVVAVGLVMILISVFQFFWGVSTPNPSDAVQKYECGSVLQRKISLSTSSDNTNNVCREAMDARSGSVFWLEVLGLLTAGLGVAMLVLPNFRKKEKVEEKSVGTAKSADE